MNETAACHFVELVQKELSGLKPPVEDASPSKYRIVDPSRELYGLALSGGGIRSATFNLGLLQALHRLRLLRSFHYLSTVSGGGYVGSFWSAWRARNENQGKVFPEAADSPQYPEPHEIRHLREFSNFLAPRLGLLSWDTGRMLVSAFSSMVPSLLAALSVLMLAVLAWCGVVYGLFTDRAHASVIRDVTISGCLIGALTLVVIVVGEVAWRGRGEKTSDRAFVTATLLAVVGTVATWLWIAHVWPPFDKAYDRGQILPVIRPDQKVGEWVYLFMPVAAWGAALLGFTFFRWATSSLADTHQMRVARAAYDRVHSRILLAATVWSAFAVLWYTGVWVYARFEGTKGIVLGTGLAGVNTLGMALFAWVQKRLAQQVNKPSGGKLTAALKPLLPQILAYAVLAAMSISAVALLVAADASRTLPIPGGLPAGVALGALAVVAATLWCLDPNEVGLHSFYRGRIARAYPGASSPTGHRKTEEQETDDLPLQFLSGGAPCHLICCAANDLADGGDMANLNRGAESAVLSRVAFSVAEEWKAWKPGRGVPTLASAVTASGAAFNSLMGSKSIEYGPAVTFLMAAFNLRLGLWWPHPTQSQEQSLAERTLVGMPFFREMFGRARSRGRDVHLSDGAHFENLAVYELIRRHCRVIVASDCGMDPDVAFDDFGNLVRRVREDFGVDIRIDLSPLQPNPDTKLARQPMVAGDIHYPEGDTGVLLLFKPTLVGSEPADIAQYRRRNSAFPHETTGDQFYDEAQWESYRRLGEHATLSAFEKLTVGLDPAVGEEEGADSFAAQVFSRARREWMPVPDGFADRVSHLADRVVQLDALLRGEGGETLLREVYKEVDELDHWAKRHRVSVPLIVGPDWKIAPGEARPTAGAREGNAPAAVIAPALQVVDQSRSFPESRDLASSLHLIRRALLVFEEAYEREDLERTYHHPVYLGLINYMARWAYAPLFRMWWPLLKTLYPQPFTRFLEKQFGLAEVGARGEPTEHVVGRLSRERTGFAMDAWERQGRALPVGRQEVISYGMRMQYRNYKPPYDVQAAQVIVSVADRTLVWDADDFFVPPGLWGVGIGEDFLRRLRTGENPLPDVSRLLVRLRLHSPDRAAARKEVADVLQLYRSAGFDRVTEAQLSEAERNALVGRDGPAKDAPRPAGTTELPRWVHAVVRR